MHMVIRALVFAKEKDEALEKAKKIFSSLCGEDGQPFDYYSTFDDSYAVGRWGKLPICVKATSKTGKKFIKEGIQSTIKEFNRNFQILKQAIEKYSQEELFKDELELPNA